MSLPEPSTIIRRRRSSLTMTSIVSQEDLKSMALYTSLDENSHAKPSSKTFGDNILESSQNPQVDANREKSPDSRPTVALNSNLETSSQFSPTKDPLISGLRDSCGRKFSNATTIVSPISPRKSLAQITKSKSQKLGSIMEDQNCVSPFLNSVIEEDNDKMDSEDKNSESDQEVQAGSPLELSAIFHVDFPPGPLGLLVWMGKNQRVTKVRDLVEGGEVSFCIVFIVFIQNYFKEIKALF